MAVHGVDNVTIPALSGNLTWTAQNKFSNSNLSSLDLDEDGFPAETLNYSTNSTTTSTTHPYTYTNVVTRATGATVLVMNDNSADTHEITPSGVGVSGNAYIDKCYNSYWNNDLVDCISVPEDTGLTYGKCYCFDGEKYYESNKYLCKNFIGIHSDTSGLSLGNKEGKLLSAAVKGFVLAYVDKEYPAGTPLVVGPEGALTRIKEEDIPFNSIVATYWKNEPNDFWGGDYSFFKKTPVSVNGRKWVKVI